MEIRELDGSKMLPNVKICRLFDTGTAAGWRPRKRIAEYYELIYYTEGTGSVFINGEEQRIRAGDVRFTKPGTQLYGLPGYKSYSVMFDFGQSGVVYKNPMLDGLPDYFHVGAEPMYHFEKMVDLFQSPAAIATVKLNAMLLHVLCMLYDALHTEKTVIPAIKGCVAFLERNFSRHVSLEELCSVAGYSRPHLLRLFSREIGCSPHEYLTSIRIQHAKKLLTETDAPLSSVAADCGFRSDSHFKTLFKTVTGLTPNTYRNMDVMFDS